ncbi:MAG: FeoB-associated Cys-rich membrane protein [Desulfobulbus sp.]
MQHLLVAVTMVFVVFFLGRRLWKAFSSGQNLDCGCGCSGCSGQTVSSGPSHPFPMHKP